MRKKKEKKRSSVTPMMGGIREGDVKHISNSAGKRSRTEGGRPAVDD